MEIKPVHICLDASTVCQLDCPSCLTARGEIDKKIGTGFLKFKDFKKIVDNYIWVCDIELSNWGEIFLNPDLLKIIKYAYKKNIILRADNGVNLNTANDEILEALVKYKFLGMTCSIDGATQKTYSVYRRKGNFGKVIGHIKKINYYKSKYKSTSPVLTWQFIPFGHNEHEIQTAKQMAKDLNMKFFLRLSDDELFSPVKDKDLIRKESGLGASSRREYLEKTGKEYMGEFCTQLWRHPQINFDGKILGCCVNFWGDFGNAFKDGLFEGLNNEKINYARQMLLGKKANKQDIPCATCRFYKSMKKRDAWIKTSDVKDMPAEERLRIIIKRNLIGQKFNISV